MKPFLRSELIVGNTDISARLRETSGLPVIRPERMLCKADYNRDRVPGLQPSVHKPDLSVWTGSVFE
jgi:hypothetical protein